MNASSIKQKNIPENHNNILLKLKQKETQLRSIQQIGMVLSSELHRDRLVILIMQEVTKLMHAERGTLYLVDSEKGELWSVFAEKSEIKEIQLKIGQGIAGYVAKTGKIINIKDAYQDERFDPRTDKKTGYKTKTILCVPIKEPVKNKKQKAQIIGVLQILNKHKGVFKKEDEELLLSLASQISISLINSRLYSKLENHLNELDLLYRIEKILSLSQNHADLFGKLLDLLVKSLRSESGFILIKNVSGILERFALNIPQNILNSISLNGHNNIFEKVINTGEIFINNEVKKTKLLVHNFNELKIRHILCAPLITHNKNIGILVLINKHGKRAYFSENDKKLISSIAGQAARGIYNIQLKEEQERKDRLATIGNMMSSVVHDLRTPMNNIYGFVDLMSEEDENATRKEYADIINDQIRMLTNMTTDVLDFARGKSGLLFRKYPVDKLVNNFVQKFEKEIKDKGFNFNWEIKARAMVYVDTEKMQRAFMNIMKNALEAMEAGGNFSIIADENKNNVIFKFSDTGTGIPEEIKDNLFESFVTSGKENGTGLGLAIVKKIIEAHKGSIEVDSKQGHGTTFIIKLAKI